MTRFTNTWSKILISTFSIMTIPTMIAFADGGVVTERTSGISDMNEAQTFELNELVDIEMETETHYQLNKGNKLYLVEKGAVLKTSKEQEVNLEVIIESTTLKNQPNLFSTILSTFNKGDILTRVSGANESGTWVKVKNVQGVEGWVLKETVKSNLTEVPNHTNAFIKTNEWTGRGYPFGTEVKITGFLNNKYIVQLQNESLEIEKESISFEKPSLVEEIIEKGITFLGVPYVWGGTAVDGFDCSGYIQYIYRANGIEMPRVASDQSRVGELVEREKMQRGDLVFFETYKPGPSHVGVYLGNNQFLHAGGDRVQISDINENYWSERYLFAKRQ